MAETPRSVEFQHGATYTTVDGKQVAVDTAYLYGTEYVYPGSKSGPIPLGAINGGR